MSWLAVALATLAVALQQSAPQKPVAQFAPSQLLELPFPADARLGIALVRAARGEFEAGASAVAELATERDMTLTPARIDREGARLAALAKARREFLERCVAEKKKFKVEQDGKPLACTVAELAADRFVLVDARGNRQEVAIATLTPELLLKRMSELKLETGSEATRAYAGLLAAKKNWAKAIDGASDAEAAALRADAPEYSARLATGAAGLALQELAATPVPEPAPATIPSFDATITAIAALLRDHKREAIVVARVVPLRQLATDVIGRRFDAGGIAAAGLKGEVKPLPDGGVQFTYEFKLASELEDFVRVDAAHPSWSFFEIKRSAAESKHAVEKGALQMVGQGCLRHRLEFDVPMSATFDVTYAKPDPTLSPSTSLRVALCDDGKGSMVTNLDLKCVDVLDAGRRIHKTSSKDDTPETLVSDHPYTIRIEHDGKVAKLQVSERAAQEVAAPTAQRKRGGVAIYWKADAPVTLARIVIEGKLAPGTLEPLRNAAIAREMAALFGE